MTRHNAAIAYEREGPLMTVGLIWAMEEGKLRRYVVRRHRWSGRSIAQGLAHITRGHVFCPRCLTHNVWVQTGLFQPADGATIGTDWSDCLDCGLSWWVVDEPKTLSGE